MIGIANISAEEREVRTLAELKSAISESVSYIKLMDAIELGNETLTISSGNIILDVNEKTLSATRTSDGIATCINVNGGCLTVTGGGLLSATSYGATRYKGKDAIVISYNDGEVHVLNVRLKAVPTKRNGGLAGSDGKPYTLDPNGKIEGVTRKVSMMVPYGAYIIGGSQNDYNSEGLEASSTTVGLTTYNVTYDTNGGLLQSPSVSSSYTIETKNFKLPTVSKTGYTFNGWLYNNNNRVDESNLPTTSDRKAEVSMTFNADLSLDNYSISYELNKGSNPLDAPSSFTYESDEIELPTPTRDNYRFMGWYSSSDFSGTRQTSIPKESLGNKTFYAKWYQEYSITYNTIGGEMPSDSYPTKYVSEESLELPVPIKEDNGFVAWFDNSNLKGTAYHSIPKGLTGDKTFYAKWLHSLYITYNLNGGMNPDGAPTSFTVESPKIELPIPTREGYKFAGWYKDDSYSGSAITSIVTGTQASQTFYAKWTPISYKITYNLNGGSNPEGAKSTYTIEDNDITLPTPTRAGGSFDGWFSDSNLSQSIKMIPKGSTGDKTLYAKWNLTTYTIKLDTKGGSSLGDVSYTVDTDNLALSKKSRKNGYNFVGWYKDENCTQPFGETIPKNTSGNFTLYAKWEPIKYTITYETYSDVKVPSSTYTIEQEIALPVPQRDAYSFVGWYESDRLEGDAIMTIAKETTGNKKLYAKWSAGSRLNMSQAANGTFTVKNGDKEVKSGDYVGPKTKLTLTATPVSPYTLSKWVIDGKEAGSDNPTTVEMPATNGLAISAIFVDNRTAATAPEIITDPANTERVPKGESVKVKLNKKDDSAALYYSVDGAPDKAYTGEFFVASPKDTLLIKAIARKPGFKDGVTTRQVIFDNSKITLTFNLPLGVKAVNSSGGEVVTATTTGGSFEFELKVDREYYTNLDSMVVSANDSVIKAGSAGLYTLTNCTSDVTITVAGLKAKVCSVTLQQTDNGTISFTDGAEETTMEVEYGASVSVTAKADEDFKFLQWSTGSQSNPLKLTVDKDTTISARFINDYKAYAITLPQLEGVTVKPFTGYSTEVKKDGTFKFYLKLADGYREENPVVRANGEVLAKNKGGYAIYKVNKNISISVEGIVREPVTLKVPGNVNAKVVETMNNASTEGVYEETMILLHAEAPTGKIFDKWTDGKTDNPRMVPAVDAEQLHPLFTNKGDANYAKVILNQSPGAGITAVNANIDGVKTGETVQLNVVLLPAYSQSEVTLTVDGEVLKPSVSLRAASETKTYMYSLPVKKDEITVKVSGMKLNTYNVSLAQTDGGVVYSNPAGTVTHGDKIQLKAEPEPGMLFVKWWDGNTLNPYPYTVTADTEVKASFLGAESTVDNESIRKDDPIEITTDGNRLSIKVDKEYQVYIYNFGGGLYQKRKIPAGGYSMYLPNGEYLIKVGDDNVRKVIIL